MISSIRVRIAFLVALTIVGSGLTVAAKNSSQSKTAAKPKTQQQLMNMLDNFENAPATSTHSSVPQSGAWSRRGSGYGMMPRSRPGVSPGGGAAVMQMLQQRLRAAGGGAAPGTQGMSHSNMMNSFARNSMSPASALNSFARSSGSSLGSSNAMNSSGANGMNTFARSAAGSFGGSRMNAAGMGSSFAAGRSTPTNMMGRPQGGSSASNSHHGSAGPQDLESLMNSQYGH